MHIRERWAQPSFARKADLDVSSALAVSAMESAVIQVTAVSFEDCTVDICAQPGVIIKTDQLERTHVGPDIALVVHSAHCATRLGV
jgi:hypothetical protein